MESNEKRLKTVKNEISEKAKVQLLSGVKKQKMQQISEAIQIFYDLNMLVAVIKDFVNSLLTTVKKVINDNLGNLLDSAKSKSGMNADKTKKGPGKAAMPTMGSASSFRPRLWSALDEIFENIFTSAIQVEFLEASLHHNRSDFISMKSYTYLEVFPQNVRNITHDFWNAVNLHLEEQLAKCSKNCKFVKEALEGEYPRFLRLYMDLCKKLQINDKPENFSYQFCINKNVVAPFEQSYLSNLDAVVSYPVHNMFSSEGVSKVVPSTEDIDSLIRIIRRLVKAFLSFNLCLQSGLSFYFHKGRTFNSHIL